MLKQYRCPGVCQRQHNIVVFGAFLLLLLIYSDSIGSKATIDADGGANYTSLDAVLSAIAGGSDWDTIQFIGSDQDSYTWSTYCASSIGTLVITSNATNPDLFPIITHTESNSYNFFNVVQVYFEKLIITTSVGFNLGQTRTHGFKNCVIRDCSGSYFIHAEGTGGSTTFENCLFETNTSTNVFDINFWSGTAVFSIMNCTFDANTSIWDEDPSNYYSGFSITNCIFSGNGTTFRGNNLRGKTTYSLTSEALTGYSTGCVSNATPSYVVTTRNNPSDWKITASSPAKDIGTSTGAPSTDISGFTRTGVPDAGCYEVQSAPDYTWDVNSSSGIASGNGTWGTHSYWTVTGGAGTSLVPWPGAGNSATFAGGTGTYIITINGTVNVDSITFIDNTYTLQGGTAINFGTKKGIYVATGKTVTISTPITGTGGITKTGTGILYINGTSTYSGTTTISDGAFSIGVGGTTGAVSGNIVANDTLFFNRSDSYTFSGDISGTGSVYKSGTGTLIVTGTCTHTGGTQNWSGSGIQIGSGGTIGSLTGDVYGDKAVVFNRSDTYIFTGTINGTCAITKSAANTLILTGTNTTTGGVTISAGTVQIGNNGTSGSLSNSCNITNNAALTFYRSDAYTYGGNISGTGSVTKNGTAATTLSGTHSYSGATTVSAGRLYFTGSSSANSAITVSSGATLGGTGTINGTVSVSGSGTLSPGTDNPGTLTLNNTLTFVSGATFDVTVNGTTAGGSYDQLSKIGTVTLGTNTTLSFNLGYSPALGDSFVIINNDGSEAISNTFVGVTTGDSISKTYDGVTYKIRANYAGGTGNDLVFKVAKISYGEDYDAWSYSKTFTLNTTVSGADVSTDNINFPVLIRLNPGNFSYFSQTLAGGTDIRFAKTNGVHLRYAIERWVDNAGNNDTAEIWVKIDTVYGDNETQSFKMYWGKAGSADSSRSALVFDTGNGYIAAYYLNQSSGAAVDYTYNALNGTANGNVPTDRKAGQIGYGQIFDGNGDYFNSGHGTKFDVSANDKLTIMAWVKPAGNATAGPTEGIVSKWRWNGSTALQYELAEDQYNGFYFGLSSTGSNYTFLYDSIGNPPTNGNWYHVVGQMDASKMRIFINGIARDSTNQSAIAPENANADFKIGMIDDDGSTYRQYYNGVIDQVTLSRNARTPDWIKLVYENQKTDQTLIDPENYSTWSFSTVITINTSGITTSNCYGFPLLVRLTKSTFNFALAQSSGQDIRFAKANGMPLPYQIERWDNTNGYADVWVRVDTIFGNNATQYITMYWGKSTATSKSNGAAVFSATNGFLGSWHFGGNITDATGFNTSNDFGSVDTGTGLIGKARAFNGSSQYVQAGNIYENRNNGAISCWMRPKVTVNSSTTTCQGIWGKAMSGVYNATLTLRGSDFQTGDGTPGKIQTKIENDAGGVYLAGATSAFNSGSWYYVTWTWGNNSDSIYLNGSPETGSASSYTVMGAASDEIGRSYYDSSNISNGLPRYFNGTLDEFRIECFKRSPDWIKLCYENQKANQTISSVYANYSWDRSSAAGITTGSGTWGTSNPYWTVDSVTLIDWPGKGNAAIFSGADGAAGAYAITVSGTQYVDSITFLNTGYALSGGTLNFGSKKNIYLAPGKTATISSVIAGTGGLTVASATTSATLSLNGSNTYNGVTTLGPYLTLNVSSLGNGGAAGCLGQSSNTASNVVINNATLALTGGASSTDRLFTVGQNGAVVYSNGSGSMSFTNSGSLAYSGSGTRTIEFGGSYAGANTFTPIIGDGTGGATSIIKSGANSIWLFSGSNTFTGTITINAGVLRAGSISAFGNSANTITVNNTGAIDINGYNLQSYTGITINGTYLASSGAIYNSGSEQQNAICQIALGSNASIGNDGNRFDIGRGFSGDRITGNGYTLTKIGNNTVGLVAQATTLGGLVITGGTILLENDAAAGSAPITIGSSGTLTTNGTRTIANQLTLNSGTITTPNNASYTTTYNGNTSVSGTISLNTVTTNSLTFGGVISGSATINKAGTGTLLLSNANTCTGIINVNAGTLTVTGSTASGCAVAVSSGATLCGTGNVQGAVSISNSGIIAPGTSGVGNLSTGALTLNNTSVLNYDLGTTSDTIKVNGDLTLDGTLNINLTGTAGSYTIMTYTGTLTNNTLTLGTAPTDYTYAVSASGGKVILDIISRKLLPITVKHNVGTGTSDTCLVYTDEWSLIFDEDDGGQIKFLSKLPNGAGTNQMSTSNQRNLFSVEFNQGSYNVPGVLKILEIGPVHALIENTYTLSNVTFTDEYMVYGSGQIFFKVKAENKSGSTQTQPLSFLSFRDETGGAVRKTSSATASSCYYFFNGETSDTTQFDIIMSLYDLWTDATGFVSTTNDYSCLGITKSSYSFSNDNRRVWEFMIDFGSKTFNDTSASTNLIVNDYRNPDSLAFIAGTRGMEQTWEHHLYGHWLFDESSGDTARDNSTSNRHAYTTGTFTTSGKWGNGLQLNGSQSATVAHHVSLNGDSRLTVMAWIKVASFGATAVVMGKHNGTSGWKLSGNATNQVTLQLDGTTFSGVTNVADNQWHHIAANFTTWENDVSIFVDGKLEACFPSHYTVTHTTSNLVIGNGVTGTIDDARYYAEHISESTLKSIYQLGYRSAAGTYHLRADNNNTVHIVIDGNTYRHAYPSFTIENYWATTKPAAGCVVYNGTALVENTGYYAYLDDLRNTLRIVLNKIVSTNSVPVYIDDNYANGYQMVGATKKMSWGVNTISSNQYVWTKNFPSDTFGSATSNQWYANWNISRSGSSNPHRDGEIWYMASSVEKANTKIDTTSSSLIPGSDVNTYFSTLGNMNFVISSNNVKSSENVGNAFTAQIAESSSVRVRLRVNERQVSNTASYRIVTEWTMYPTGQFFRYDSLYQFSAAPSALYMGWYMRDQTNATLYTTKKVRKRAAVLYSSGYPDFAGAWLSMRNASGYQAEPFDSDTISSTSSTYRVGFDFYDGTLPSTWNSTSIQTAVYLDMSSTSMTTNTVDSVCRAVQTIGLNGGAALAILAGTLVTTSTGDLDLNGFNERQGAYILNADDNTVNFKIPARHDTCRFYPAFVIKNYYAARKPNYVFGYNATDTTVLLDGYQYNAYLNRTSRELVMQFDSVFCDSAGIYISADKTLAVTISELLAKGGVLSDTIRWQTESEQENLGFYVYRRIKPEFLDSINAIINNNPLETKFGRAGVLVKSRAVNTSDTQWVKITEQLIPGAVAGASVGPRKYEMVDSLVYDSLVYEYRLKAIDFENRDRLYGPVKAMPISLIKLIFRLGRNFPNPFRGYTVIQFTLPEATPICLDIYDLQGRLIKQLIKKDQPYTAGMHKTIWDGTNSFGGKAAAGTYIYHLNSKKYKKAFTMLYVGG